MDDCKIPMPTEEERRRAISHIVAEGLPRRISFGRELWAILEQIGFRGLLFGAGDCLALSLLIWALCLLPTLALADAADALPPTLFLFSPLLYAVLSLLTGWKNLQTGLWEWTWTFRISARMVMTLRMLSFGALSVLVCVPATWALWLLAGRQLSMGWMLSLSLSSLFLYGTLSLFCQRLRGIAGSFGAPTCWTLLGLVLLLRPRAAEWLEAVPTAVFCLLAGAGIALYLLELRRFCRRPMEGSVCYALH